jgi:hypothetical protein
MRKITFILGLFLGFALSAQVGINTDTPLSTLDINGNLSLMHITVTATGGITDIDDGIYLSIQPTGPNQQFRLPDATAVPGRIYILRNITSTASGAAIPAEIISQGTIPGANPGDPPTGVLFFAGNSDTGIGSVDLTGLGGVNKTLIFISDGSNWTYGHLGFN